MPGAVNYLFRYLEVESSLILSFVIHDKDLQLSTLRSIHNGCHQCIGVQLVVLRSCLFRDGTLHFRGIWFKPSLFVFAEILTV